MDESERLNKQILFFEGNRQTEGNHPIRLILQMAQEKG